MIPSLRWCVKVGAWQPGDEEWQHLLRQLPSCAQSEVQRFKFAVDQRRAIVSRLLQRKCCAEITLVPFSEVEIQRTKGGKPYCANTCDRVRGPNFNFNVSHEVPDVPCDSFESCLAACKPTCLLCRGTMLCLQQSHYAFAA